MNREDVTQLYKFNKWANATVLKSVAPLSTEELTRHLGGSFPSIRDTLVHIMAAEWIWLRRWKGTSPSSLLNPDEFRDLDGIRRRWLEIESEQMTFVHGLTDEALKESLTYLNLKKETLKYPLGRLMQHVVNHSTYHRGQVANYLRQLTAQPAATDFVVYLNVESNVEV
jgi:uncharacterized damage-inducible protein DinB